MPKVKAEMLSTLARAVVSGAIALLFLVPLASAQIRLLPAPREAHFAGEAALPEKVTVSVPGHDADDEFAARDLEEAWKQAEHAKAGTEFRVLLLRAGSAEGKAALAQRKLAFDAAMEEEGYVLAVEPHQAVVVAASGAGVFYGVQTLKQLLPPAGGKAELPTGTVRDWPAMKYRGIDDDLSRGPFPTLEFMKHQLRVFAAYKINIYSPYFEHTLYYPNQPMAAPPGSALMPSEVEELVRYARPLHITVLPDQEAFGHLHHVLKFDLYQDVSETPHGQVLSPVQSGSLPLIKDWFTQIAKEFPSQLVLIGADETFDLGQGRTGEQMKAKGYGTVYVDFLKQIHESLAPLHRRLLFWGDIGDSDPKAVAGLPKDMIAVPWNYWDTKGFDAMIAPFAKAGIETWVAPGDANWDEVYPDAAVAFGNIQGFIRDGQRLGSTGALTTVWNDNGEGLFNQDWYGVLFGAAAAWQPGESSISAYQDAWGQLFHGDVSGKVGEAEKEMMAARAVLAKAKLETSSDDLFWLDPWSAEGQAVAAKLLPLLPEMRRHAEQAIVLLAQAREDNPRLKEADALTGLDLGARRLDLIGMKFEYNREIEDKYAQAQAIQHDKARRKELDHILDDIAVMGGRCPDMRDAYSAIKDEYIQLWRSENRPYWLGSVTVRYDLAIEQWQRRGRRFEEVFDDADGGKDLPPLTALGMAEPAPVK